MAEWNTAHGHVLVSMSRGVTYKAVASFGGHWVAHPGSFSGDFSFALIQKRIPRKVIDKLSCSRPGRFYMAWLRPWTIVLFNSGQATGPWLDTLCRLTLFEAKFLHRRIRTVSEQASPCNCA